MSRLLHLIDSLAAGGAETVCVNLVNELDARGVPVALCATRALGPLAARLRGGVPLFELDKQSPLDLRALLRLRSFCRSRSVTILHAHSTSLFTASLVAGSLPATRLIWHDHYGDLESRPRAALPYRLVRPRVAHAIAANERLLGWQRERAGFSRERSSYLPNFVTWPEQLVPASDLPGGRERRVVCVANFRPQKGHELLLEAFARTRAAAGGAHLLLVGAETDRDLVVRAKRRAARADLTGHVHFLGPRADVPAVLAACAVGVLASRSEGLPLALLEYGHAGLLAVASDVGQCGEVLDQGSAGLLVSAGALGPLASALERALSDGPLRAQLGARLQRRVREHFGREAYLERLMRLYGELGFEAPPR